MVIKVDMKKAYDRVEWDTLKAVLLAHSFSEDMCNVVLKCISSMHYSVLTNGFLTASLQDLVASAKEIRSHQLCLLLWRIYYLEILLKLNQRADLVELK